MKLTHLIASAALVFASAQASAFTPPYHINGTTILGTATFKSGGGCKVPSKKFVNAQYGSIQDSTNASVGSGVISADGMAILAVSNSAAYPSMYTKYFSDTVAQKAAYTLAASYIDDNVLDYIVAQSGCASMGIWTAPTSTVSMKQEGSGSGAVIDLALKQSFSGYLAPQIGTTCAQPVPTTTTCKGLKKFSGGMTFKGQYIVP